MLKINLFKILPIIFLIMIISSCKTKETSRSFTIGKGGGFTGKYDMYKVMENGLVYKVSEVNPEEKILKFDKKQTAEIFKQFEQLNIAGTNFSHPGNMTSFIRYQKNGKTYEIKWGSSDVKPPQNVVLFFDLVWSKIRQK